MRKSGIEYTLAGKNYTTQLIINDPSKNDIVEKIIEKTLGKYEACINNKPGRFSIVATYTISYKNPKEA